MVALCCYTCHVSCHRHTPRPSNVVAMALTYFHSYNETDGDEVVVENDEGEEIKEKLTSSGPRPCGRIRMSTLKCLHDG